MIYPTPNEPPGPTLNAFRHNLDCDPVHETAEQLRARHLRTCQELIETGMDLAREAAHQARQDMQARPPGPSMPGSAAAEIERANARARLRGPNHAVIFARLSQSVRQTLALQAHIAEGSPPKRAMVAANDGAPATPQPGAASIPAHPETRFRTETCDWALPSAPDGQVLADDLLRTIRADLTHIANTSGSEAEPADDPDGGTGLLTWPRLRELLSTETREPPPRHEAPAQLKPAAPEPRVRTGAPPHRPPRAGGGQRCVPPRPPNEHDTNS